MNRITAKQAEYNRGYDRGDEIYGLDDNDREEELQHIKNDFKDGRISKSYYKGFVDGYNDAGYGEHDFTPIK